ncbi:unnamed protein product, partial [Dibothriocephalus latus]
MARMMVGTVDESTPARASVDTHTEIACVYCVSSALMLMPAWVTKSLFSTEIPLIRTLVRRRQMMVAASVAAAGAVDASLKLASANQTTMQQQQQQPTTSPHPRYKSTHPQARPHPTPVAEIPSS